LKDENRDFIKKSQLKELAIIKNASETATNMLKAATTFPQVVAYPYPVQMNPSVSYMPPTSDGEILFMTALNF
jgi:hypothetical protein